MHQRTPSWKWKGNPQLEIFTNHISDKELVNNIEWIFVLVLSHFSYVRLCATLWTVAHQAPLSMGFYRQEYWSGLPCPPPVIKPTSLLSPALAGRFFTAQQQKDNPTLKWPKDLNRNFSKDIQMAMSTQKSGSKASVNREMIIHS